MYLQACRALSRTKKYHPSYLTAHFHSCSIQRTTITITSVIKDTMEDDSFAARMEIKNLNKLQLYSASTPNGIKVAAMLEEIVDFRSATGDGFDYEPHTIDLRHQETRRIDFKQLNPNGKIPVIVDPHGPGSRDIVVFESGAILMYLAEKYGVLLAPLNTSLRYDTMKWFMWGSTGVSSQFKLFGYYYKYCKHNMPFCIARYEKECKRLLSVLEHHLNSHGHDWIVGGIHDI